MKLRSLLLLLPLLLGACAGVPTAPDSTALRTQAAKLNGAVAEAKMTAARVSGRIKTVQAGHLLEMKAVDAIAPKLVKLEQDAPPELAPQIEAVKTDVAAVQASQATTQAGIDDTKKDLGVLTGTLEEATAAAGEVRHLGPEYFAEVDKLAAQAARDKKESDRRGNFLGWMAALMLASLAVHLVTPGVPMTWGIPLAALPIGYFAARLLI